jgi:hypothetical protein
VCGLPACSAPTKKSVQPIHYFDVPGFFERQVQWLEKEKPGLEKRVETNGKSANVREDSINWDKELAVFLSINLNKAAFIGKISVDSVVQGNRLTVSYTTNDKKMDLKSVRVQFTNDSVNWIEARKSEQNALFTNSLFVRFRCDSGYTISGVERITGVAKSSYNVSARIVYH